MGAAIFILALPVFLQHLLRAFVGMTDKLLAGQLPAGESLPALDAIGIGSYVAWFIGIALGGIGIGGQAIIARAMGSGDVREGERALGQVMSLAVIWGSFVGAALWILSPLVADFTGLSPEAKRLFLQYIRTLAAAMPLTGIVTVGSMALTGSGDTKSPAIIALGTNVVNVFVSWALAGADLKFGAGEHASVIADPFGFDMGVLGIALGTAASELFAAVCTLAILRRGVRDLRLHVRDLHPSAEMSRRVIRIGIPSFFEGISMWVVNLIVLVFLGMIAADSGAKEGLQGAQIVAIQWEAFSFMPGFAIGTAGGALCGQYLGAGNIALARRAIIVCTVVASIFMGLFGVVFMAFGHELTSIISHEPIHLEHAPKLLFICGCVQVFFAVAIVVREGLRGAGDARWMFILTAISVYGVRLPLAWFFGVHLGHGIEGIWYGLCGEFLVRASLFTGRLIQGGWAKVRV